MRPTKKKNNRKPKLNITLREEKKQKLAALAELEKRSVSNLIEVMADERWDNLADREGVDWAKTVAEIAGLKGLNANKEGDRKVFRREILERVLKSKKIKLCEPLDCLQFPLGGMNGHIRRRFLLH